MAVSKDGLQYRFVIPVLAHDPVGSNHDRGSTATWFETRGVAALLTMRV